MGGQDLRQTTAVAGPHGPTEMSVLQAEAQTVADEWAGAVG